MERKLKERDMRVHFIDPEEYKLPLLDKRYYDYEEGDAPEQMERLASKYRDSDGYLLVTGEYNHGLPPALKNLLDHFLYIYFFKPSAIVSYSGGRYGGVRASVHLRAVTGELGMPSISSILPFPSVGTIFEEDGSPRESWIDQSTEKFLNEFEWYMEALKTQRSKGTPY
jgi:NAD(P)H-dependent FMN reductase